MRISWHTERKSHDPSVDSRVNRRVRYRSHGGEVGVEESRVFCPRCGHDRVCQGQKIVRRVGNRP